MYGKYSTDTSCFVNLRANRGIFANPYSLKVLIIIFKQISRNASVRQHDSFVGKINYFANINLYLIHDKLDTVSSLLDRYLEYFMTPYFIFVRDTLSYLTLLGLHLFMCLAPSTVTCNGVEWAIFLFFLGRIAMEGKQFIRAYVLRGFKGHQDAASSERGQNVGVLWRLTKYFRYMFPLNQYFHLVNLLPNYFFINFWS